MALKLRNCLIHFKPVSLALIQAGAAWKVFRQFLVILALLKAVWYSSPEIKLSVTNAPVRKT
jgi:hypothetical protein